MYYIEPNVYFATLWFEHEFLIQFMTLEDEYASLSPFIMYGPSIHAPIPFEIRLFSKTFYDLVNTIKKKINK